MPVTSARRRPTAGATAGEEGYFPEGRSALRQVHGERSVGLMFGQRALTVGAIKPLNFLGTADNSGHKGDPFKRLTRTAIAFETIFFGSKTDADRVLRYTRRMHERVHGETQEDAGVHPAGTKYDAFDPALMLWTVAAMMDSAEAMHDLLVRPLRPQEREALWQDYKRFAALFGAPAGDFPASYGDFREYYEAELAAEENHLSPLAHYTGWFASFDIPSPALRGPVKDAHNLVVRGSLPEPVRELYGLEWTRRDQQLFSAITASRRLTRPFTPPRIARGANTATFKGIAREEARRLAAGKPTPHLRADGTPGTAYPLARG